MFDMTLTLSSYDPLSDLLGDHFKNSTYSKVKFKDTFRALHSLFFIARVSTKPNSLVDKASFCYSKGSSGLQAHAMIFKTHIRNQQKKTELEPEIPIS